MPPRQSTIGRQPQFTIAQRPDARQAEPPAVQDTSTQPLAGAPCTGPTLTHSASEIVETTFDVACVGGGVSAGLFMARSFVMPTTSSIGCVRFGVEANMGGAWPVEARLKTGIIKDTWEWLTTVATSTVVIPNNQFNTLYTASFPGGVMFTAGQEVIVELHTASRVPADGGDGGTITLGCNNEGQTAPTYVRSPTCGLPNFVNASLVGFPQAHLVITLISPNLSIDCSNAVSENEPCGTNINNGCHTNPTPNFSGFECGMSVCGELMADAGGTLYDVDWYTVFVQGPLTRLTATVYAQMPVHVVIVGNNCNTLDVLKGGDGVFPTVAEVCVPAGEYRVCIAPAVLDGYPCGAPGRQYRLTVDCAPSTPRNCCDDEAMPVDPNGDPILPPEWDGLPPITVAVDVDHGKVEDLYPQFNTSLDVWYESNPCNPIIGDYVSDDDENGDSEDELTSIGITEDPAVILEDLDDWEQQIAAAGATEPDWLSNATPVTQGPYQPSGTWCPQPNEPYVFGGRDIVLVHGLRLEHLFDRFLGVPGAQANWVPPTVFPASQQNPQFFGNGYFKLKAEANWQDYIDNFLTAPGYNNRYLVVCYPSTERLERGVHAVLTQIAEAMKNGTGVMDLSGCGNTANFGSRSFVILSHSTGAPITDVAMHAAATKANLGAAFIPQQCKAHIAPSGAFLGSHLATAAVGISGYISALPVSWPTCVLAKEALKALDPDANVPNCGTGSSDLQAIISSLVKTSVLVDLVPRNTQGKWGSALAGTPVRTITAVAGHPNKNSPLKFLLHRGFDDGVVNMTCQTANSNLVINHPAGFFPNNPKEVFDRGLRDSLGKEKRAKKYYKDQKKDSELPTGMVAAGATRWVSPSGMLQPPVQSIDPLRSPEARYPNHFSFLQSAASHPTAIRAMLNYPFYDITGTMLDPEQNWEETRVVTDAAVYAPYSSGLNDNAPLLSSACMKPLRESERGQRLRFGFRLFGKTFSWEKIIWKRTYHLFEGTLAWHQIDYIHHSILCQPLDCAGVNCDPSPCPGDVNGSSVVDIDDLVTVITSWGTAGGGPADVNHDNIVNIDDLVAVITSWGACP